MHCSFLIKLVVNIRVNSLVFKASYSSYRFPNQVFILIICVFEYLFPSMTVIRVVIAQIKDFFYLEFVLLEFW